MACRWVVKRSRKIFATGLEMLVVAAAQHRRLLYCLIRKDVDRPHGGGRGVERGRGGWEGVRSRIAEHIAARAIGFVRGELVRCEMGLGSVAGG
jgi:hypothetical protein